MRILFDSKKEIYKTPFGCVVPGERCTLRIRIPVSVGTSAVTCVLQRENGEVFRQIAFSFLEQQDAYCTWQCDFSLEETGLFFYYFLITGHTGTFRLFKYGDDTNMEDGGLWQLSCVPQDFTTPDWAKGAVIYQVFPDRFCKSGLCDLTGKLEPYTLHQNWDEEVQWQPDEKGEVLNNDFFGGNFRGVQEKMDYIASLGTTILYVNPISKSFSNHRYDTGDYKTPDPMLGTEADFRAMCEAAHAHGIRVILDGVFSHTGADSLYFDKNRNFGGKGAYCDSDSPYRSWYTFQQYPHVYDSWWGFETLPTVRKMDPAFLDYIIEGEDSVIAHYLSLGADGFRLDVADELPNEFVDRLKKRLRALRPDALLIGEVWEDASNKISYGIRRRYFTDGTLDSIMNYPFRKAILDFVRQEDDGRNFANTVMTIAENYPPQVLCCNMNLLGSHDTPRIMTALVDNFDGSRQELACRSLSLQQRQLALERLVLASVLQYTLPGSPSIYYGDEAGMEGGKDPFNRRTYPWGRENSQLLDHYRLLGSLRKKYDVLATGKISFLSAEMGRLGYARESLKIFVNQSREDWQVSGGKILMACRLQQVTEKTVTLQSGGWCILEE